MSWVFCGVVCVTAAACLWWGFVSNAGTPNLPACCQESSKVTLAAVDFCWVCSIDILLGGGVCTVALHLGFWI